MRRISVLFLDAIITIFISASESSAKQTSISSRLAPMVEAGGWLIVEGNQKYLLLNTGKFSNESWFRNGVEVAAMGEIKRGAATIY